MKKNHHSNSNVVMSWSYDPQFEKQMIANMRPHDRHQHMLEEHKQAKATRREKHRKRIHRMSRVLSALI